MNCRYCKSPLNFVMVDLNNCPPSNSYLSFTDLSKQEEVYPLKVMVCEKCFLVQIDEYKKFSEIFTKDYAYFSSYSKSWLEHSQKFANDVIRRFHLNSDSYVVELASNDGYLLQFFKKYNIPTLGIEPTANTALSAVNKGIETIVEFFTNQLAEELRGSGKGADLLVANNVLAHVPDILDFVGGMKTLLNHRGVITVEFPHLLKLIDETQFDTIYHEHYSYLSFTIVNKIFQHLDLEIFDVEELQTHGGSLRVYAQHKGAIHKVEDTVSALLKKETAVGVETLKYYESFGPKVDLIKSKLLMFLNEQKKTGKTVAGYGAAAKGNTLLNYAAVKGDLIKFVVDKNPHKQGKYLPGSHIPIVGEAQIKEEKPDIILILPWNLKQEIMEQLSYAREWDCKFVTAIPHLEIM